MQHRLTDCALLANRSTRGIQVLLRPLVSARMSPTHAMR
jgi:hypothetical protein